MLYLSTQTLLSQIRRKPQERKQVFRFFNHLRRSPGEAVDQNSLLAAALPIAIGTREVDEGDGPRCCGQGFFAYFLFLKKVGEKAV